ncbi:unnamed protein product [Discula destructiva]
MYALILIATLSMAVAVLAAPAELPSRTTPPLTGVTHRVVAGRAGQLIFDPENVVANVGDVVEWQFLPKNHSVAQSSFAVPCIPDADVPVSFFSGFQPTAAGEIQAPNVFQIVVEDTNPIWYYCAQTTGGHCQKGMAGVINQNFNSPNTLTAYKNKASLTQLSVIPPVQGGKVLLNPHPNDGA